MALPPIENIARMVGDTYAFSITITTSAGVAVDITGNTILLDIVDRVTNESLHTLAGVILVAASGTVSFTPTAAIAALVEGIYNYSIRTTDATPTITSVLRGTWTQVI